MELDNNATITPTPVRIAPPPAPSSQDTSLRPPPAVGAIPWLTPAWLVVIALAGLALAAVFVLPGSDTGTPAPADITPTRGNGAVSVPVAALNKLSPQQRVQRTTLRHLAGDALDALISARKALSALRVTAWEPLQYRFAEQEAARGETQFRLGDYNAATFHYRNAVRAFTALLVAGQQLRQGAIAATLRALAAGDAPTARAQLARALQIGPAGDLAALKTRVDALPRVLAAAARGDAALDAGDVGAARREYQAALALDSQYQPARDALAHLATQAAQRQYLNVMSKGYSAMQQNAFDAARAAFEQAKSMHPDRTDAQMAMIDLAGNRTTSTLQKLQADGARLLAEERFADATSAYQQALAIDRTLAFAKTGIAIARERQQLLQTMDNAIAHPERQSSDETHKATQALRDRVARLDSKGALLQSRLAAVDALLARSSVAVTVTLQSDNVTEVRLYRIGAIGHFAAKKLDLRPGRYVATGVRDGYRDVRKEFDVAPNMQPVSVRCEEAIQ